MEMSFNEQLEIFTHQATDSAVLVELCDKSQGRIRAFHGELRGPHCSRARTLPASFPIGHCECDEKISQSATVLVTDPCYWTPELPMLYDVVLELELTDGTTTAWQHTLGLRRWEIHGRHLFCERKRIVLRGVVIEDCLPEILEQATAAEVALVVRNPQNEFLEQASILGVPLVIDLRDFAGRLTPKLLSYGWQPAVALVLLDDRVASTHYKPHAARIGGVLPLACGFAAADWADVIVFELDAADRPPAWAVTCAKPVIAIRRAGAYAELAEARRGCDRLQAELAPQFDLAGYFD